MKQRKVIVQLLDEGLAMNPQGIQPVDFALQSFETAVRYTPLAHDHLQDW